MMWPHQFSLASWGSSLPFQGRESFLHWLLSGSVLWWLKKLLSSNQIWEWQLCLWGSHLADHCHLCPACPDLEGQVWHFSVCKCQLDWNSIDLILCLQRVGIFPLFFFLLLYSLRSKRVKQRHWVLPVVLKHRGQCQSCKVLHGIE